MNEERNSARTVWRSEVGLSGVARLLLRNLHWLIAAGIAAAACVFLAVHFLVTPKFKSHVSFYVYNSADGASHSGTINNSDLQAAESLAATYSKILESNSVLDAVLEAVGNEDFTRKELAGMIDVAVVSDTQLLEVTTTSADPGFACRVAQAFADVAPEEIIRITKAGGVEIVDRPEIAKEKSSPRTVFDTVIGFVIGVIGVSVILLTRMVSDTTIYLPEDLNGVADVTLLGQIPKIDAESNGHARWNITEREVLAGEE